MSLERGRKYLLADRLGANLLCRFFIVTSLAQSVRPVARCDLLARHFVYRNAKYQMWWWFDFG
jgi:hypothetical protein